MHRVPLLAAAEWIYFRQRSPFSKLESRVSASILLNARRGCHHMDFLEIELGLEEESSSRITYSWLGHFA
jgi:hypothetical protein